MPSTPTKRKSKKAARLKSTATYVIASIKKSKGKTRFIADPAKVKPTPTLTTDIRYARKYRHRSGPHMILQRHADLRSAFRTVHIV